MSEKNNVVDSARSAMGPIIDGACDTYLGLSAVDWNEAKCNPKEQKSALDLVKAFEDEEKPGWSVAQIVFAEGLLARVVSTLAPECLPADLPHLGKLVDIIRDSASLSWASLEVKDENKETIVHLKRDSAPNGPGGKYVVAVDSEGKINGRVNVRGPRKGRISAHYGTLAADGTWEPRKGAFVPADVAARLKAFNSDPAQFLDDNIGTESTPVYRAYRSRGFSGPVSKETAKAARDAVKAKTIAQDTRIAALEAMLADKGISLDPESMAD